MPRGRYALRARSCRSTSSGCSAAGTSPRWSPAKRPRLCSGRRPSKSSKKVHAAWVLVCRALFSRVAYLGCSLFFLRFSVPCLFSPPSPLLFAPLSHPHAHRSGRGGNRSQEAQGWRVSSSLRYCCSRSRRSRCVVVRHGGVVVQPNARRLKRHLWPPLLLLRPRRAQVCLNVVLCARGIANEARTRAQIFTTVLCCCALASGAADESGLWMISHAQFTRVRACSPARACVRARDVMRAQDLYQELILAFIQQVPRARLCTRSGAWLTRARAAAPGVELRAGRHRHAQCGTHAQGRRHRD